MDDDALLDGLSATEYWKLIDAASKSFLGFVKLIHPTWIIPQFHLDLIDTLDKLEKGELKNEAGEIIYRMMVNMPPRHAKSTICTVLFPAYYMLRNYRRHVLTSSYSSDLAKDFGQGVRDIVMMPRIQQAFPEAVLNPTDRAKDEWSLVDAKGKTQGKYFSVGARGSTTGRPACLLVTDDPIKNRIEAESPTYRKNTWAYYQDNLENRKEPSMNIDEHGDLYQEHHIELMILTRWHPDDVGGRIQKTPDWKAGEWKAYSFAAISTDEKGNEKALWEERFPLKDLKKTRQRNPRGFQSMYQQEPYVQGGSIFETSWWGTYKDFKEEDIQALVVSADTAFKATALNDYSVLVTAALMNSGDIYILDVKRGRWEYPELKRVIQIHNARWRGKSLRGIHIEDAASGQSLIQDLRAQGGMSIIPVKVTKDKVSRAKLVSPMVEGGLVHLPDEADWLEDFMTELEQFPNSTNDDQVDALVIALSELSKISMPMYDGINGLDMNASLNSQVQKSAMRDAISNHGLSLGRSSDSSQRNWRNWGE